MSQRTIEITDYKDRTIGSAYMLANGGFALDLDYGTNILHISKQSTDDLFKLIMDDRRERGQDIITIQKMAKELQCPNCFGAKTEEGLPCICRGTNDIKVAFDWYQENFYKRHEK